MLMSRKTPDHFLWDRVKKTVSSYTEETPAEHVEESSFEALLSEGEVSLPAPDKITTRMPVKTPEKTSSQSAHIYMSLNKGDFPAIERKAITSLRKGDVSIAAKIDLHGMTQERAFDALMHFIPASQGARRCVVLVVTGKGRGGDGVLKQNVPSWLNHPTLRPYVLGFDVAHPKHGGDGALYVMIRKASA